MKNITEDVVLTVGTLALVVGTLWVGFTFSYQSQNAQRVLESQFTGVELTGYAWGGCGDEISRVKFSATNAQGKSITGVVCKGFPVIGKSATVRFY